MDTDSTTTADPIDFSVQATCGDAAEFERRISPEGVEYVHVALRMDAGDSSTEGPRDVSGFPYFYKATEPDVIDRFAYLAIRKVGWQNGIDHGFTRQEFTDAARSDDPERVLRLPSNGTATGEDNASVFGTSHPENPTGSLYNEMRTNGSNSFLVLRSSHPVSSGGCWTVEAKLPLASSCPEDWTYLSAVIRNEDSGVVLPDMELVAPESSHDSDISGSARMAGIDSGTYEFIFYLNYHDEGQPNVHSAYQEAPWFRIIL